MTNQPQPEAASRDLKDSRNGLEIAVIGLAGRFPGANNIREFWRNLRAGVNSISRFTDEELLADGADPQVLNNPHFVRSRGVIEDIFRFDAAFFGYSPREAEIIDPQQRIFLECAWAALEDAGYNPQSCRESVGVYAGLGLNSYFLGLASTPQILEMIGHYPMMIGNDKDFLATRVSYKLNLKGPSLVIQTACSTSLVAVHQACRALLGCECDMALAGAVSITAPARRGYLYQEGGILSPDGMCRVFDAEASGTVPGGGVGIVVLKRLEDALESRDHIRAVIKGTAINNDGSDKIGFTAPGIQGQAAAVRTAQLMAEIDPESISYIEAHGTGTVLGDPIEIKALSEAFAAGTARKGFCRIGSVKSNIGHLDAAAGVAGLIKTALALEHQELPASLQFKAPNPQIEFSNSPFLVNDTLTAWSKGLRPRRAGVSSFGLGGTNAHVILEEAPEPPPTRRQRSWRLLPLSAKTRTALDRMCADLSSHFKEFPQLDLGDVAYTLQRGRQGLEERGILVCDRLAEAASMLDAGRLPRATASGAVPVVFLFPGGGAQYVEMGLGLYREEAIFRDEVDACLELVADQLDVDLRTILYPEPTQQAQAQQRMRRTSVALPALFIIEYAMARTWMALGIRPQAMIGHSLGEYVAACLAGVFSLADALSLVVVRGRLFERMPRGAMLSVTLSELEMAPFLHESLSIAAINGPRSSVVSGPCEAIEALAQRLESAEIEHKRLQIEVAAHSRMIEPILDEFHGFVQGLQRRPPQIPMISNVTGTWLTAEQAQSPSYWVDHLRGTVRFAEGARELLVDPRRLFLEVGPGRSLTTLISLQESPASARAFVSMRHPQEPQADAPYFLTTLGKLWMSGADVEWEALHTGETPGRVSLPTYPFEGDHYQLKANPVTRPDGRSAASCERSQEEAWFYQPSWTFAPRPAGGGQSLRGERWMLLIDELGVGAALYNRLIQAGAEASIVRRGARRFDAGEGRYVIDPNSAEDYRRLLESLALAGKLPQRIVHLWGITPPATDAGGRERFNQARESGYSSLLLLAQAMNRQAGWSLQDDRAALRLSIVTNRLQDVSGDENFEPEKAPVLGLCQVLSQEFPALKCRSIDVAGHERFSDSSRAAASLADEIFHEILSEASGKCTALRGERRWVKSFAPIDLSGSPADEGLRENGVYLLIGGFGGVGWSIAQSLAGRRNARLALAGRRGLPPQERWEETLQSSPEDPICEKIRQAKEWIEAGVRVRFFEADATDPDAMRAVIDEVERDFGALHGVFFAAGVRKSRFASCPAAELDASDSDEQFDVKVRGLYVLAEILRGQTLDFCLLISSNASVLGGLGLGAYSAAHHFMDAFAQKQRRRWGQRWISVNWDGWRIQGELASDRLGTGLSRYALTKDEAWRAIEKILASGLSGQIAVSTVALQDRMKIWIERPAAERQGEEQETPAAASIHGRPELATPYLAPRNEIEREVSQIWRELMGMDRVGVEDNFFDLGGHSLLATRILTRLRGAFGVKLPLRAFFEVPTVAGLSTKILEWLAAQVDEETLAMLEEPSFA